MDVKQINNSEFTSNTYVISEAIANWIWLIDIGNFEGVLKILSKDIFVRGVFLTHTHYDHIYEINKLFSSFPDCAVYTSEQGKKGLFSDKLNLSYYHEDPVIFMGSDVNILHEPDRIELFENIYLETLETPGHSWSCLTYKVENYLFTGDSYIPYAEVVTKLKGGKKDESKKSLNKIMNNISRDTIICPGHGEMTQIKE
jgi:glyoxylase-like metal-dependent hydrolase (beta-lactamase superfamily II)